MESAYISTKSRMDKLRYICKWNTTQYSNVSEAPYHLNDTDDLKLNTGQNKPYTNKYTLNDTIYIKVKSRQDRAM